MAAYSRNASFCFRGCRWLLYRAHARLAAHTSAGFFNTSRLCKPSVHTTTKCMIILAVFFFFFLPLQSVLLSWNQERFINCSLSVNSFPRGDLRLDDRVALIF